MASFNGPKLTNQIRTDVPDTQNVLVALAKQDPTPISDIPSGAKRLYEASSGNWKWQEYNGSSWADVPFLQHNVDQLDGYHAAITPAANTVAVRNADKKLEGDITGNAATATSATTLSQTLPVNKGGTGATTAAAARTNLGVPPTSHASSSTTYGLATDTNYGHVRSDGTTTKIVAGEVVAKDVAIGEDADDFASQRGQIGKCRNLTSSIDFNTLFKTGRYWINNVRFAASSNRPPATVGGFFDVLCDESGGNYTKQIYHAYNNPIIYIREHRGPDSGWSENWTKIITEKDIATTSTPGIVIPDTVSGTTAVSSNGRLYVVKAPYVIAYQVSTDSKTYKDLCESYRYAYGTSANSRVAVLRAEATDTYNNINIFSTFFNGDKTNKIGASLNVKSYSDNTAKIETNCDLQISGGNRIVIANNTLKTGDLVVSMNSQRSGCLLCNGSAVSRTTYADLFALLGTAFGEGDGSTTFNLPDFRNKTLWGANGDLKKVIAAGLPNITSTFNYTTAFRSLETQGAIRIVTANYYAGLSSLDTAYRCDVSFDASRSNYIYGGSTTVQPPAIAVNIFIKY